MPSNRLRVLLALLLVLPLAGCSAAGSLTMTPVDDTELTAEASQSISSHQPDTDQSLVRRVVENGTATANGTSPPVDVDGKPYEVDGAYYDLSADSVGSHTEVSVSLAIDYNGSAQGPAVAYEDLPPIDRALVDSLLPPEHDHQTDGYDMGASKRYNDAEAESSMLLSGEYEAVRYDGERYPIKVETRDVTVRTYRYTAEQVASNQSEYADLLRDRHLFTLSDLSDAEHEIVQEATNDTYHADSSDDDAFRSVLDRFLEHDAVNRNEYHGEWIVKYQGEVYWAELDYDGFSVDEAAG